MHSDTAFFQARKVVQFSERMIAKLQCHSGKGTWQRDSPAQLLARLKEEVEELEAAIVALDGQVFNEAADVANFAMMIADVCGCLEE